MRKYAICVTAGPSRVGSALNGFEYAISLLDAGHDVAVFLDGEATKWPGEVDSHPDHPVGTALAALRRRRAIEGACAYCADVYDTTERCEAADAPLIGTAGEDHAPDVGALATEGYELLSVG